MGFCTNCGNALDGSKFCTKCGTKVDITLNGECFFDGASNFQKSDTNRIIPLGKIVSIVASIIMIILISGKWLNLHMIPLIFDDSVQHEYSIFEIADFINEANYYLEDNNIKLYAILLSIAAIAIILIAIFNIVFIFIDKPAYKLTTSVSFILSLILMIVFVGVVHYINVEVKEATYGGIDRLLKTTSNPYWIVVVSALTCIGVRIKSKI